LESPVSSTSTNAQKRISLDGSQPTPAKTSVNLPKKIHSKAKMSEISTAASNPRLSVAGA